MLAGAGCAVSRMGASVLSPDSHILVLCLQSDSIRGSSTSSMTWQKHDSCCFQHRHQHCRPQLPKQLWLCLCRTASVQGCSGMHGCSWQADEHQQLWCHWQQQGTRWGCRTGIPETVCQGQSISLVFISIFYFFNFKINILSPATP